MLDAASKMADTVGGALEEAVGIIRDVEVDNGYKYLAKTLLGKTSTSFKALRMLCSAGYGADAFMLLRTVFESGVNLAYVGKDPDARATQYLDYAYVENHKLMDSLIRYTPGKQPPDAIIKKANEDWERVKGQYGGGWTKASLETRACECGWGAQYALIYRFASTLSHAGASSAPVYMVVAENGFHLRDEESDQQLVAEALLGSIGTVYLTVKEVYRAFGVPLPERFLESQHVLQRVMMEEWHSYSQQVKQL
ncbi:MAG: DUF5677 domain-containing protein [Bacillota bacterium]